MDRHENLGYRLRWRAAPAGEGAYEGLVYHQLYAQSPHTEDHYVLAGWIEPAG